MQKNKRILIIIFLIFGVLVAPHEGEFWPFSIFPMFSQAGNPWVRSHVRVIESQPQDQTWQSVSPFELDGEVLAMSSIGVNQNDVSNFVSKTVDWNERSLNNLRNLIGDNITREKNLMVYKVTGMLHPDFSDSVIINDKPLIMMTPESTILNPEIGNR